MRVTILTTGGTIEKTYNERDGSLRNYHTILPKMLATLRLPDLEVTYEQAVLKDSLEMTKDDRVRILQATQQALACSDAVMILHGTDTLGQTGELLHRELRDLSVPCRPARLPGSLRRHAQPCPPLSGCAQGRRETHVHTVLICTEPSAWRCRCRRVWCQLDRVDWCGHEAAVG